MDYALVVKVLDALENLSRVVTDCVLVCQGSPLDLEQRG